jgi:hypothetical protein
MTNIYIILHNNNNKNVCYKLKQRVFLKIVNKNCIIENNICYNNNSRYYFLKKKYNIETLQKLKNDNNYLIYEPLDIDWDKYTNFDEYYNNNLVYFNLFNEIICNNILMSEKMKELGYNNKVSINYHEYDEKYKSTNKIDDNVLYIGRVDKSSFTKEDIIKYNIKTIDNFNEINKDIAIHIDYLINNNLYYTLHTSTKLSTALYLNCIFICNRISVYVELLGEDYNFYLNDDLSNILDIINNAKEVLNNKDLYNNYIDKYTIIRNKLSPNSIAKNYNNILNNNIDIMEHKEENKKDNTIVNKNFITNKLFINKKNLFKK